MTAALVDQLTPDATEYGWRHPDDFPAGTPDGVALAVLARVGARPRMWTATELMATDFPEPRFAIPGIIPEGLTLLCSTPKFGKSWLTMGAAVALAAGGRALGRVEVGDPADVLVLALEDPPRRLKSRLTMLLEGDTAPARLTMVTEWPPDGMDMVRRWLDDHPDAAMVVVDVLARTRPPAINGESVYGADYRAVTAWKAVADDYGVAVVLVHHTRKAGAEDFLDTVSGTQGLAGAADAIIVLRRARGSADAEMHLTGRDVAEATFALRFDGTTGLWLLLDEPPAVAALADTRRRIVDLLADGQGRTPKQVADALGIKHDTAKQTCSRMFHDDQLDTAEGYYPLPPLSPLSPSQVRGGERGDTPLSPQSPNGASGDGPPHTPPVTHVTRGDSGDTGDSTHGATA